MSSSTSVMVSPRSQRGLDLLSFFLANVQTGFGPFIAVYLAGQKWTQVEIGIALSVGTVTAMLSQLPAGALVDWVHDKRAAGAGAVLALFGSAILISAFPGRLAVNAAEVLHGIASCVVGPAVAAVSLSLVGIDAMGERIGRNARFGSIGNALAAAVMGGIGYFSERGVFIATALLALPALVALRMIRPSDLVAAGPRTGDAMAESGAARVPVKACLRPGLVAFMLCVALFHLSNAAQLPLASVAITRQAGNIGSLVIAACILGPQLIVALVSPRVGDAADRLGRRPVLLLGFAALPLRALLLAGFDNPWLVTMIQLLDGVSGAVFGVMLPLVAADLTRGTGRYNLAQGALGLAAGLGATLSTIFAGLVADQFGSRYAFVALAGVGLLALCGVWLLMPETRPGAVDPGCA